MTNSSVLLIPSYKPDYSFINFCRSLAEKFSVVVVNDGSPSKYEYIYDDISKTNNLKILTHDANKGKGSAIKTGVEYIKKARVAKTIITADADGQHTINDIERIAKVAQQNPHDLILGVRNFDKNVPFRSKFGNELTKVIFKLISGRLISDTQTGLRAIPNSFFDQIIDSKRSGYELELESLLNISVSNAKIIEVPISTIYLDNNASSHFRPLIDSAKIYFVFFRYVSSSLLSFMIDFLLFSIVYAISGNIFLSTYLSRPISGIFNYFVNMKIVFQSKKRKRYSLIYYFIAFFLIMHLSASIMVYIKDEVEINTYFLKILVDLFLFIFSFLLQRYIIFNK